MKFATGQYALALCDRCGQQYDYISLREEWNGLRVCPECFEQKHPQLEPRSVPFEPEALRNPRPDRTEPFQILVGQNTFPLFTATSIQAISSIGKTVALTSSSPATSISVTGLSATGSIGSVSVTTATSITYTVTVASGTNVYGTGNKFYLDGSVSPTLSLNEGSTYRFDQSDSSNSTHPLRFSTTANGTWGGGSQYTTGVTTVGTPGSAGAYTEITIPVGAPTLYYYCTNHSGMGGTIYTIDTVYTVTVASGTNPYGTGNKFYLNGSVSPTISLAEGGTFRFDQSDSSNSTHPLRFSTTPNGTHAGGGATEYTTGVTTAGTPGSSGAYTEITVASGAPTLYYYCTNHSGMGGQADTP